MKKNNLNKEKVKVVDKINKKGKVIGIALLLVLLLPQVAYANGGETAVQGVNNLKELVMNVLSAIGFIVTGFGVFDFSQAWQNNDGASRGQAVAKIAGGILLAAAPQILKILLG